MAVKSGFLSVQDKDDFVREWLAPGSDPTGLIERAEKPPKKADTEQEESQQATDKE